MQKLGSYPQCANHGDYWGTRQANGKMAIWPRGRIPGTQDSHNEGGLMGPLVQCPQSADLRPEKGKTNRRASSRPDLLTPLPHPTPGHQAPPVHSARWRKRTVWPLCAAVHRMSPPRRAISQCDGHRSWFPEAQDHKHDLPRESGKEDQQRMLTQCPYSPTTHPNSPPTPTLGRGKRPLPKHGSSPVLRIFVTSATNTENRN